MGRRQALSSKAQDGEAQEEPEPFGHSFRGGAGTLPRQARNPPRCVARNALVIVDVTGQQEITVWQRFLNNTLRSLRLLGAAPLPLLAIVDIRLLRRPH